MLNIGIDIGSTTAKLVAINAAGEILFSKYVRHNAKSRQVICDILHELQATVGEQEASVHITGSIGMGLSEETGIPFVQEVVAASKAVRHFHAQVRTMIDIGGEDSKVVFFDNAEAKDLRMNGNCAGGTGAFIDQMAVILGVDVEEMNDLAQKSARIYPIASRCGVFCKTDVQNLIAKNVSKEDIAASIFHAVAVQTVVTLAHGSTITPPVLFCGGPLSYFPALRKAFCDYLHIDETETIISDNGKLLPAIGTALTDNEDSGTHLLSEIISMIEQPQRTNTAKQHGLSPIFSSDKEYQDWQERMKEHNLPKSELKYGRQDVFLGIDSGSTTTKIVVTDVNGNILFSHYSTNGGNPVTAVEAGLLELKQLCTDRGTELNIIGSCSTGYGEDLIKAAFQLNSGIVETIAHYIAAASMDKDVSFILDIGGQDMKAIFVDDGVVNRIEINEACSSGCGSFISTFANTLGYQVDDFAEAACHAENPCDLGTRCTVFMNSKVKQVLREGATVNDIAAGLAYSVVKNCIYKVLKIKDISALGKNIVVQGGTMRNNAVVRVMEILTGVHVSRCDLPELMGAYGCALYAGQHTTAGTTLDEMMRKMKYTARLLNCKGCENQCLVSRYEFASGKKYYSGNRCERVFNNGGSERVGENLYELKNRLLFDRITNTHEIAGMTIGIPRCLNMYEDFPFWHTLLTECGINVVLSDSSNFTHYETCAWMVMSDNICFPAKLVHSHIQNLLDKKVDRIFLPFVVFERRETNGQNSYNCPIVTGYSEVVKGIQENGIPVDSPAISFKDRKLLYRQCCAYLESLGIIEGVISKAFIKAEAEQEKFVRAIKNANQSVWEKASAEKRFVLLHAGRPYHTDPLIQHRLGNMIARMGIDVITEDIVRDADIKTDEAYYLAQWGYPNRILKAAKWSTLQPANLQFAQFTSFGCGPDAFLMDEVRDMLINNGKSHTLLKLDDINNVGSMKLRVRSLVESLKLKRELDLSKSSQFDNKQTFQYESEINPKSKKVLVPFFTPFISPLIPAILSLDGYDAETLPVSDDLSGEYGLKYANNEVCYPATLIVGDIVKAMLSGKYDPANTVIAMTQTGGQCRASNYVALMRKALSEAGFGQVPVVILSFGSDIGKGQPTLKIDWLKLLPVALRAILFSDCIAKFYHAAAPRENSTGKAAQLRDDFLSEGASIIKQNNSVYLYKLLDVASQEFDAISLDKDCPKVGIVGEIFLKFNPYAHKNITEWLVQKGIEVVPSALIDFFMQSFVNRQVRRESHIEKSAVPMIANKFGFSILWRQIQKVNSIASKFRYFRPFTNIFEEAEYAKGVINLNAQFGEGWLLPAEILSCFRQGVRNVISLQPFGCIANHIVSKGIERRIKNISPDINVLSLDFDSGVSDVNITNRLLLFLDAISTASERIKV